MGELRLRQPPAALNGDLNWFDWERRVVLLGRFRRLAKSTLLLIPLFGINFIVFAFIPEQVKTELRLVFDLILGSFQVWHQRGGAWSRSR